MAARPIVVYAERPNSPLLDFENETRAGLAYFLRHDCACDVVLYDSAPLLLEDAPRLKRWMSDGRVLVLIIRQQEYSQAHLTALRYIRKRLSATCPVVIIPAGIDGSFKRRRNDPATFALHPYSEKFVPFLLRLRDAWRPAPSWTGCDTMEDQAILRHQLERAYRTNYLDSEDGVLAVPDYDGQVVAEAIRLRLLPAVCLKAEFDDALARTPHSLQTVGNEAYAADLAKLRALTSTDRRLLEVQLHEAMGSILLPGGGVQRIRASLGEGVIGFAIDPVSLESQTTHGFSNHSRAEMFLKNRLELIEELRRSRSGGNPTTDEDTHVGARIMTGIIHPDVNGYATPIVLLVTGWHDQPSILRVARHLIREQRLLPVTMDGQLIEG